MTPNPLRINYPFVTYRNLHVVGRVLRIAAVFLKTLC